MRNIIINSQIKKQKKKIKKTYFNP